MENQTAVSGDVGRYPSHRSKVEMKEATLSHDERAEINRLIDQFIAGDIADPLPERSAAERRAVTQTSVLPAVGDWSGFGGVSRDATIVWVDRDPPYATRPIDDARTQRLVLFQASIRYSSLSSLRPTRPEDARDCNQCGGTGRVSFGIAKQTITMGGRKRSVREMDARLVCYCGGLGWLLNGESQCHDQ